MALHWQTPKHTSKFRNANKYKWIHTWFKQLVCNSHSTATFPTLFVYLLSISNLALTPACLKPTNLIAWKTSSNCCDIPSLWCATVFWPGDLTQTWNGIWTIPHLNAVSLSILVQSLYDESLGLEEDFDGLSRIAQEFGKSIPWSKI